MYSLCPAGQMTKQLYVVANVYLSDRPGFHMPVAEQGEGRGGEGEVEEGIQRVRLAQRVTYILVPSLNHWQACSVAPVSLHGLFPKQARTRTACLVLMD